MEEGGGVIGGGAVAAGNEPDGYRRDEAEGEEPEQGSIEAVLSDEAAAGPHDAPEDAAVEVDAGDGAGEAVDGVGVADGGDVGEHPV